MNEKKANKVSSKKLHIIFIPIFLSFTSPISSTVLEKIAKTHPNPKYIINDVIIHINTEIAIFFIDTVLPSNKQHF